jgi:hypothetical protein
MDAQRTPEERNMLDLTKPVQTREGHKVRILCTNRAGGLYPIVALVDEGRGIEVTGSWTRDGLNVVGDPSPRDLINVPPPTTKVNVEVRLVQTSDGVEAYAKCANGGDIWWPHDDNDHVIASTAVEIEYEAKP